MGEWVGEWVGGCVVGKWEGRGQVSRVGYGCVRGMGGRGRVGELWKVEGVSRYPAKPAKTISRQMCKNRSQEKENRNSENRKTSANPVLFCKEWQC